MFRIIPTLHVLEPLLYDPEKKVFPRLFYIGETGKRKTRFCNSFLKNAYEKSAQRPYPAEPSEF
jgi:hypothetical protein